MFSRRCIQLLHTEEIMNAGSFIKGMGAGMAVGAVGAAAAFTMMQKSEKTSRNA